VPILAKTGITRREVPILSSLGSTVVKRTGRSDLNLDPPT
jgi:hypothetical protein